MGPRGKMLTMSDKRIIHDQRISVERPFMKDWNLHIRQVNQSDSGEYLCQINTRPVKSKKVLLHINGKGNDIIFLHSVPCSKTRYRQCKVLHINHVQAPSSLRYCPFQGRNV